MRDLDVELIKKAGLIPPVLGLLSAIPEGAYSYSHYGLRHPGGIFNKNLGELALRLVNVCKLVSEFQQNTKSEDLQRAEAMPVLNAYTDMLVAFGAFIEVPYEILLGACPALEPPGDKMFLHRWLLEHKFTAGKLFYSEIRGDVQFFKELLNKLKHTSRGLRPATVFSEGLPLLGYYLEGVASDGAIAADVNFHEQYDRKRPGNTFNRDLRRLYYCIYEVCDALQRAFTLHLKQVHKVSDTPIDTSRDYNDQACRDLFERVQSLPDVYFRNEVHGRSLVPYARIENSEDTVHLKFQVFPARQCPAGSVHAQIQTIGDGFSRSFRWLEL